MHTMTVRAKLIAMFGGLLVLLFVIAGLSISKLSAANNHFEEFVNGINNRALTAHLVREAIDRRAIAARNIVLENKPEELQIEKLAAAQAHADVTNNLAKLQQLAAKPGVPDKVRELINNIATIEKEYAPVALDIVDKGVKQQREEAIRKINDECRPLLARLIKATDAYADFTAARSQTMITEAASDYAMQRNTLLLSCLIVTVMGVIAGWVITRNLTNALGAEPSDLCEVANHVANGDLRVNIHTRAGDTTSVMAAMDRMLRALSVVVQQVREGADGVAMTSAEIAGGNNDLSSRTEMQAGTREETAASMEELGATVQKNSEQAEIANGMAQRACQVAMQGGKVVEEVVSTMSGINESSRKISDIISVIDGIAFQTNILALNAAVEAARAGEQGRGFAVVASEVRGLASRSAAAAKEIKVLIQDSVQRVEQGSAQVHKAGVTMTEVVTSIQKVTDIMAVISAANKEQSQGVTQIGEAVSNLDHTTQKNAALVEEIAAAAISLKNRGQELVHSVAVFKLA